MFFSIAFLLTYLCFVSTSNGVQIGPRTTVINVYSGLKNVSNNIPQVSTIANSKFVSIKSKVGQKDLKLPKPLSVIPVNLNRTTALNHTIALNRTNLNHDSKISPPKSENMPHLFGNQFGAEEHVHVPKYESRQLEKEVVPERPKKYELKLFEDDSDEETSEEEEDDDDDELIYKTRRFENNDSSEKKEHSSAEIPQHIHSENKFNHPKTHFESSSEEDTDPNFPGVKNGETLVFQKRERPTTNSENNVYSVPIEPPRHQHQNPSGTHLSKDSDIIRIPQKRQQPIAYPRILQLRVPGATSNPTQNRMDDEQEERFPTLQQLQPQYPPLPARTINPRPTPQQMEYPVPSSNRSVINTTIQRQQLGFSMRLPVLFFNNETKTFQTAVGKYVYYQQKK